MFLTFHLHLDGTKQNYKTLKLPDAYPTEDPLYKIIFEPLHQDVYQFCQSLAHEQLAEVNMPQLQQVLHQIFLTQFEISDIVMYQTSL